MRPEGVCQLGNRQLDSCNDVLLAQQQLGLGIQDVFQRHPPEQI